MKIQSVSEVAKEAIKELIKIQEGGGVIQTGFDMLDNHIGGLLPSDVVVFASLPGVGKSQTLYDLLDSIFKSEVNVDSSDFISLEYSMEMKMLNKLIRTLNKKLSKKKRDILFNSFSKEEQIVVDRYMESLEDNRKFVCQVPVSTQDFYSMTKGFIEKYKHKKAIIVSIDHLLLFTGSDKQLSLEQISDSVNQLKLEYSNVYFILLSQLNRSAITVIKNADNAMMPNNTMLFGSSFMEQLASYIIIISNPFKLGINQYLKINPERYDYLEKHFTAYDAKNDKVSFETLNRLFYTVTKARETDDVTKDLYIKELNMTKEQLDKLKIIDKPTGMLPVADLKEAFGDIDMPF